jgi:uncharacterized protein YqhQ
MGNNWYMDDKGSTKRGLLITRIGVGIIATLFLVFGLFVPSVDPTHLYDNLHPASLLNVLGVIFFIVFLLYIAHIPQSILENLNIPVGSTWPNTTAVACGILGVFLMYA